MHRAVDKNGKQATRPSGSPILWAGGTMNQHVLDDLDVAYPLGAPHRFQAAVREWRDVSPDDSTDEYLGDNK